MKAAARARFAELERELTAEFGPVPDEVTEQVRKEWDEFEKRAAGTD